MKLIYTQRLIFQSIINETRGIYQLHEKAFNGENGTM